MFLAPSTLAQTPSLRFLHPFQLQLHSLFHGFSLRILSHRQASVLRFPRHLRPSLRLPPPPRGSQAYQEIQLRPNPNSLPRETLPLLHQHLSLHAPQTPPRGFQVQRRRLAPRTAPRLQALPRLLGHHCSSVGSQAVLR